VLAGSDERGGEDRERRVLRAADGDVAVERAAAVDDDLVQAGGSEGRGSSRLERGAGARITRWGTGSQPPDGRIPILCLRSGRVKT